ncbi:hypothetical protein LguiA_000271 [Lonicera macranthoides]
MNLFPLIHYYPLHGFSSTRISNAIDPAILPKWIESLHYLAKLVLQYCNLSSDPLKMLQGLLNLVVLELREAYGGEELRELEIMSCEKLEKVPLGIEHLGDLQVLVPSGMGYASSILRENKGITR